MNDFVIEDGVLKTTGNKSMDLETVIVPKGVTRIDEYGLSLCRNAKTIIFPKGLRALGRCALFNFVHLEQVVIPDTVETIEKWAFSAC